MRLLSAVAAVLSFSLGQAHAAVPTQITVQGKVTDAGGTPLPAGAKTFTFRIFNASAAGTQVWPAVGGELQSITTSTDGLWIGLVGAANPLTDSVFADSVRWLEITVDGTTLPRVRLFTGPYAHHVGTVDGATGGRLNGSLTVQGSTASAAVRTNSSTITLDGTNSIVVVTQQLAGVILPDAASCPGRQYTIKNASGGMIGIYSAGGNVEFLSGGYILDITNNFAIVVSGGIDWRVVAK